MGSHPGTGAEMEADRLNPSWGWRQKGYAALRSGLGNGLASVLIFGQTFGGDLDHSVWAYNQKKSWAVLITV